MSNPTSQGAALSLVELLKPMAHDWRSLAEQANASPSPQTDDCPKVVLTEKHWAHPIWDLFRLIEEATGIDRHVVEQVAWRINSALGLAPLKRTPRPTPPVTDPDLADLPDDEPRPDLADLRWVYPRLSECDVNGTTATILRRFEKKHPGVLAAFGSHLPTDKQAAPPVETQETTETRAQRFQKLVPAARKAFLAFELAESRAGKRLEDREAYDHLMEHGIPDNAGNAGELTDYELPSFDTWTKHLRTARAHLGEQKYTPRQGRETGKSVVRVNEVEHLNDADNRKPE